MRKYSLWLFITAILMLQSGCGINKSTLKISDEKKLKGIEKQYNENVEDLKEIVGISKNDPIRAEALMNDYRISMKEVADSANNIGTNALREWTKARAFHLALRAAKESPKERIKVIPFTNMTSINS